MRIASLQRRPEPRSAFTLIELLVVISIIAVLLSLSAGVYFRVMISQQESYTISTVTRIQKALSSQYDAVKKQALQEVNYPWPPTSTVPFSNGKSPQSIYNNIILPMAGYDTVRAQVIWVKLRLKQAFPMNFAEALDNSIFPSLYDKKLNAAGVSSGPNTLAYENSACLLLALQRSVSGGVPVDQVTQLATQQVTIGKGTLPVLVDSYISANPGVTNIPAGNYMPLAFCRWPTGVCLKLNLAGAQSVQNGYQDPEDPNGLLTNPSWNSSSFTSVAHAVTPSYSYHLQPMVVSAGPDMLLGLDPTTFQQDSTSNANDNLVARPNP